MSGAQRWIRTRIACYGAAVAIILEQLSAFPQATVTENPNPLVRVQGLPIPDDEWHPDELVRGSTGRQDVIVWESFEYTTDAVGASINCN